MRTETRVTGIVFGVLVLLVAGIATWAVLQRDADEVAANAETSGVEGHVLGVRAPDDRVVLTEFLDFECEACRAAYPVVEDLREQFAGEVTFELRYFPMPGHANSRTAAWAVEAAARQDALEPMYRRMYETQSQWGEQQTSKTGLFRTFAADLGLDLEQYDRDVASDATKERVEADFRAGLELGVKGTPTFFLDGRPLQPRSIDDFVETIELAVEDQSTV